MTLKICIWIAETFLMGGRNIHLDGQSIYLNNQNVIHEKKKNVIAAYFQLLPILTVTRLHTLDCVIPKFFTTGVVVVL